MKTLPLLASLAVTTAVSAADLKDPAAVARDWNQAVEQTREPAIPPQNLREQSDALTTTPLERIFSPDNLPPRRSPLSPGPHFDAPRNKIPPVLPDNLPPGSKPWEYNGRTFWLIPIGPERAGNPGCWFLDCLVWRSLLAGDS